MEDKEVLENEEVNATDMVEEIEEEQTPACEDFDHTEKSVVEEKIVEQAVQPDGVINLNEQKYDKPFNEVVDEAREKLYKSYKKTSLINNILLVVVAAIFIGSFFMITRGTWGQIAGWVTIGVTLAGLVIYFLLTRKRYPKQSKEYFNVFWTASNSYLFDNERFQNCTINPEEKFTIQDVLGDRAYKDIIDVASRNVVHGQFNHKEFTLGELGIYKPGARKNSREVVFVGRRIELDNSLLVKDRYLINIRGEDKPLDLPTDIDDLVAFENDGTFVVYGTEGADYKKEIGTKLLSELKDLKCSAPLLNINIVLWNKKSFAYLSYDDSIVAIPFDKSINNKVIFKNY